MKSGLAVVVEIGDFLVRVDMLEVALKETFAGNVFCSTRSLLKARQEDQNGAARLGHTCQNVEDERCAYGQQVRQGSGVAVVVQLAPLMSEVS